MTPVPGVDADAGGPLRDDDPSGRPHAGAVTNAPPPPSGYGSRSLADLLPSLAAGLGVPGTQDVLGLGSAHAAPRSAVLLLVDGLGAALLEQHREIAPTLAALTLGRSLDAGFPASTPISVASLGTGLPPGEHGLVGLTMRHEGAVLDTLAWTVGGRDASDRAVPEQVQPRPTVFERVREAGLRPVVVSSRLFRSSALTRAALRGAEYLGTVAHGDLAALVLDSVRVPGTLCYAYVSELDTVGHLHGPGSAGWRLQLREIDALVAMLIEGLPAETLLTVTGDHGMVTMPADRTHDFDQSAGLQDGVALLAGEPRVRYVHVEPGQQEAVRRRWSEQLGDDFWIGSRDQLLDGGFLGPEVTREVAGRIGDLVVVATGDGGVVRLEREPVVSRLLGQHGSWTDAERRVALAVHLS